MKNTLTETAGGTLLSFIYLSAKYEQVTVSNQIAYLIANLLLAFIFGIAGNLLVLYFKKRMKL